MKELKIFKPNILIQNRLSSCWCDNIKTLEDKIPISQFLKNKGIYALEIEPIKDHKEWYCFALPVNKNWDAETIKENTKLCFSIYNESSFNLTVEFETPENKKVGRETLEIDEIGDWNDFSIDVPTGKIRIVLFSGSSATPTYVIKDIVLKY